MKVEVAEVWWSHSLQAYLSSVPLELSHQNPQVQPHNLIAEAQTLGLSL